MTDSSVFLEGDYSRDVPNEVKKELFIAACSGRKDKILHLISMGLDPNFMFTWRALLVNPGTSDGEAFVVCKHGLALEWIYFMNDLLFYMGHLTDVTDPKELEAILCVYEPMSAVVGQFDGKDCSCLSEEDLPSDRIVIVGFHLLHLFACMGKNDMIEWYHKTFSCDINMTTPALKSTPLHHAANSVTTGCDKTVRLLVELGASVNTKNNLNETAMGYAVHSNNTKVAEALVDSGFSISDYKGESLLYFAVRRRSTSLVSKLINAGDKVNVICERRDSPLQRAVQQQDNDIVRLLVDGGADVNYYDLENVQSAPLQVAVIVGTLEICKILLQGGANPNATDSDGMFPLFHASMRGDLDIFNLLLSQPSIDPCQTSHTGYSAIHQAAWMDGPQQLCMVKALVDRGVPHDVCTGDKNTPLSLAAHGNQLDTVKYLLALGCNVNNEDKDLDTPLIYASYNDNLEMMQELIRCGADPHLQNAVATTPMWYAALNGNVKMVQFLLQHNVDLNIPSVGIMQDSQTQDVVYLFEQPCTPLLVSLSQENFEVSRLLIRAGCSLSDWWNYSEELEETCSDDIELYRWMSEKATNPDSLKIICRKFIRKIQGKHLNDNVLKFEIPLALVDFLLLKTT